MIQSLSHAILVAVHIASYIASYSLRLSIVTVSLVITCVSLTDVVVVYFI